jgi:DNA ligase-4
VKNYEPVVLEPTTVYRSLHPLLPTILKVQDDFAVAGRFLQDHVRRRGVTGADLSRDDLAHRLKPKLGVKVGRQTWVKGRSIRHCLDMSRGRISCEEKLDGEYCQIHIDMTKGSNCIQIFSKSGKDSTRDRAALHDAIRRSLHIGRTSCLIKQGCILEGELLVYDDNEQRILEFEKIRKYVSRSGAYLGTEQDSQAHPHENLMIVYFDVLLIDDESLLGVRQSQRFKRLQELITCVPGRSQLVRRHIIDCDKRSAASDLRRVFAQCITERREGLVLKPDDPYFDFSTKKRPYGSCCIKLKKEYVGGFGDVGDFAVVAARYEAAKAKTFGMVKVKWTHFYIGCLDNKEEVERWHRLPRFVVTNVVGLNATQMKAFITHANPRYTTEAENQSIILKIAPGIDNGNRPSAIFIDPPVFDIRCFNFHREGNTDFLAPRFPMVNKIHFDRTYLDVLSFKELQDMAKLEKDMPPQADSQELLGWIAALEQADPQRARLQGASQTTTVSAVSTMRTPSSVQSSRASQPEQDLPVPESPIAAMRRAKVAKQNLAVGPPTPPRSSALVPLSAIVTSPIQQVGRPKKRSAETSVQTPRRAKSRRVTPVRHMQTPSPARSARDSQVTQREALGDITHSSQSKDNAAGSRRAAGVHSFYMPSMENRPSMMPLSSFALFCTAPGSCPDPFTTIGTNSKVTGSPLTMTALGENLNTGACIHSGDACPLRNVSFLLAPCIASMPWLTEDLFSAHGITNFATDIRTWNNTQSTSTAPDTCASYSQRGRGRASRRRRFALVESRRKGAVDRLFQDIQAAQLRRRNGKREWIPVFDWKVMEELTKEEGKHHCIAGRLEERFDSRCKRSIWNKHWVGLA